MTAMRSLAPLTLILLMAAPAWGAPKLLVRARTVIRDVEKIQRADGHTVVKGRLLDKDFRHGIPRRRIEASVIHGGSEDTLVTRTNRLGNFAFLLPRKKGVYKVSFRFGGDQIYARKVTPLWKIDVTKLNLHLDLALSSTLDAAKKTQSLTATARSGGALVSVPVVLSTGRGVILARFTTSAAGKARVTFPTSRLGKPGPINLIATFHGNREINPISLRYETILETPVYLTLEADQKEVPADEEVELSGRASDPTGPVAGVTITLHAAGALAGSAVTDADGDYSFKLATGSYPPGELELAARYSPNVIWRRAGRSDTVELTVLAPQPIPVRLYAVPAIFTAALLICLVIYRFRRELAGAVRSRTARIKKPKTVKQQPVVGGVRHARRTFRSLITQSTTVSGEVWDATDTRLVVGAEVVLKTPSGEVVHRCETNGVGRFDTGDLPACMLTVTVSRGGYVSESFRCQIPHRGTLNGLRVDLVQVRVRVLEMYRDAALPLLPKEEYWAHWTPRDLVHHLSRRAGRRLKVLEKLTRLLEAVYWSKDPANESVLPRARDLADGVERGSTVRY